MTKHNRKKRTAREVDIAELESRLCFSQSPLALVVPSADLDVIPEMTATPIFRAAPQSIAHDIAEPSQFRSESLPQQELVFIDESVEDKDELIAELAARDSSLPVSIFVLDAKRDGVEQITEILSAYHHVSAVHLFSHGTDGQIQLGSATLSGDSLNRYAAQLVQWQDALTSDADLLIYGCDVAATESGEELIESLHVLTSADVAASKDITGHEHFQGDWDLEFVAGDAIETRNIVGPIFAHLWDHQLNILQSAETRVNENFPSHDTSRPQDTMRTDRPSESAVAVADNGNHVVVWTSDGSGSDKKDVFFQLYRADGTKIGTQQIVNDEHTDKDQGSASVAMSADGSFVVVWTSEDQDGTKSSVYFRLYNNDGSVKSAAIRATTNTYSTGEQRDPDVAMNDAGQFAIVWEGEGLGDSDGIFARIFGPNGNSYNSDPFRVNANTTGQQSNPAVGIDGVGYITVAWNQDGDDMAIAYFALDGTPGPSIDLSVGPLSLGSTYNPSVAVREDGIIAVAYQGQFQFATNWDAHVQLFNAGLTNVNLSPFPIVNASSSGDQLNPSVSFNDADGSLVVAWEGVGNIAAQVDSNGVFARVYQVTPQGANNPTASAITGEFRVNTTTGSTQSAASVASLDANNFVVVWSGNGVGDTDGVFIRRYGKPPFTAIDDSSTSDEDSTGSVIDVTGNDALFGTLTFTLDITSTLGSVINHGDGTFTYSPNGAFESLKQGATGMDTFSYTVSNGSESSSATVSITINGANDDSQAVDDSLGVFSANSTAVIDESTLLANDIDVDGDVPFILDHTSAANGTVVDDGTTFSYTPSGVYTGPDGFSYRVSDGQDGLRHFYRLNGNADDTVGSNHGTIFGASTVAGSFGDGLGFSSAANDFVRISDASYGSDFTVSFDFYLDDNDGTNFRYIYSHGNVGSANSVNVFLREAQNSGSSAPNSLATMVVDGNDTADANRLDIDASGLSGAWHNYTLTVENGVGTKVYIDGVLLASSSDGADGVNPNSDIFLGARNDLSSTRFYDGRLDGLSIFDVALDAPRVAALTSVPSSQIAQVTFTVDVVSAGDNSYSVDEDQTLVVAAGSNSLLANDSGPGTLSIDTTPVSGPSNGTLILNADGSFSYTPNANYFGTDQFDYLLFNDLGETDQATVFLTINPINDAPVAVNDTASALIGETILIEAWRNDTDVEGSIDFTSYVLDSLPVGALVTNNNDGSFSFTAPAQGVYSFTYRFSDTSGLVSNTATVTVGVSTTVADNLWLSTTGNVRGSGSTGPTDWESSEALQLGDPNLMFDLLTNTTTGTLFSVFDVGRFGGNNISAMHFVSRDMVIGGNGGPSYNLQVGDVLFAMSNSATLTSLNTTNVIAGDVALFRPTTLGDYSSGTFVRLLDNLGAGTAVTAFSLVEQDTLVGDTVLNEGEVLFTSVGNRNLAVYSADSVGVGTTSGVQKTLLNVGPGDSIDAVELLEQRTQVGNVILSAGTILISTGSTSVVGVNTVTSRGEDVVALTVTSTQLVSGVEVVSARTLVDGSDLGLNDPAENIDSLALPTVPTLFHNVTGTVYEDVDGDGGISDDGIGLAGVTVHLYRDGGNGTPGGGDVLVASTTTDVNGVYDFDHLVNATYFVVVDSQTVTPSAGFNAGYGTGDVWAEQTYGAAGSMYFDALSARRFTSSGGTHYAGANFGTSDDASSLTSAQHMVRFQVVNGTTNSIDFGFSFNVVTSLRGGDAQDDAAGVNRSMQGTLRQFIANANAIAGANAMRFVPVYATELTPGVYTFDRGNVPTQTGVGGAQWWQLQVAAELPTLTDDFTTISGIAYNAKNGTSTLNTNSNLLGFTGNVGVYNADGVANSGDDWSLAGLNGPELEIVDVASVANGLTVLASDVTISNFAIRSFDGSNLIIGAASGQTDRVRILNNVIGSAPDLFSVPVSAPNVGSNIRIDGADNGLLQGNLIGFADVWGVALLPASGAGADNWSIVSNEIRGNGRVSSGFDGIDILGASGGAQIRGNLITENFGSGIDGFGNIGGAHRIDFNTISGNGIGGTETSGVRLFGSSSIVQLNQIVGNAGAGVLVVGEINNGSGPTAGTPAKAIFISRNHFGGNGGISIDLNSAATAAGTGDGVTANDGVNTISSGNAGLDAPVILTATRDGSTLNVTGTAAANARVEIYLAIPDTGDSLSGEQYGEGVLYLGFTTADGSGNFTFVTSFVPSAVNAGSFVSAINMDGGQNTSEFGKNHAINVVPVANADSFSVAEDSVLSGTVAGNDLDADGDLLTYSIVTSTSNGVLLLNPDGTFTFTPSANFYGTDSFVYRVLDGSGGSAQATVSLTILAVNDAPQATGDTYTIAEDSTLSAVLGINDLLSNDADVDMDTLAVHTTPVSGPANGVLVLNADGSFLYTPTANYFGTDSFVYRISDGNGGTADATATITISAVNDNPQAGNDSFMIAEDTPLLTASVAGLLANDVDVDGDTLSVMTIPVTGPANGTLLLNADGSFAYTPNANYCGVDSFVYRISDGQGGTSDATATITISAVNDNPVANNDTFTLAENSTLSVTSPVTGLLGNDSDVDGNTLSVLVTPTSGPTHGMLILNSDGSFTYTPDVNYDGSDAFVYRVSDGNGGTADATVTLNITGVNVAPTAGNDTYTVAEDSVLVSTVGVNGLLANDSDPNGDTLRVVIVPIVSPTHGIIVLNMDGSFTYTPTANFNGTDSFVYQVSDGRGGIATATALITVSPVNDAPMANDDQFTLPQGATLSLTSTSVLDNDSDVDGDPFFGHVLSGPQHGSLTWNTDATFTYVHDGSATFADLFTYQVQDASGGATTATVRFTLTRADNPPVAVTDVYSTAGELAVSDSARGLLANDHDESPNTLTAVVVAQPLNGALSLNSNGTFTYIPTVTFAGADQFTYKAMDVAGQDSVTTVVINVTSQLPPPPPSTIDNSGSDRDGSKGSATVVESSTRTADDSGTNPLGSAPPHSTETNELFVDRDTSRTELPEASSTDRQNFVVTVDATAAPLSDEDAVFRVTRAANLKNGEDDAAAANGANARVVAANMSQMPLDSIRALLASHGIRESLDQLNEDMQLTFSVPRIAATGLVAATSTFTVGYVAWAFRAGYLLASVLTTVPTWQTIDPMPILAYIDNDDDDSDRQDSLESLIAGSEGLAGT